MTIDFVKKEVDEIKAEYGIEAIRDMKDETEKDIKKKRDGIKESKKRLVPIRATMREDDQLILAHNDVQQIEDLIKTLEAYILRQDRVVVYCAELIAQHETDKVAKAVSKS
jgi:translation initiation factor 2B subunit (eIF-2B alpha/beta/delta family)